MIFIWNMMMFLYIMISRRFDDILDSIDIKLYVKIIVINLNLF